MAEAKAWVMMANLNKDKTGCELEMYPLVLCKDCKRHLECDHWIENGDDWFCADGERNDDDALDNSKC